jgi:hypothetical protein
MLPVATYILGTSEWVVLAPPVRAHPQILKRAALAWLDSTGPPPDGPVTFLPVRAIDLALGLAVLHHRPNGTAVYCAGSDMDEAAAEILSLVTRQSTPVLLAGGQGCGPPRTRTIAVDHDRWVHPSVDRWLHPSLHPVVAHIARPEATVYACGCQITPELAGVLTAIGTEQLHLLHARGNTRPEPLRLATWPPSPGAISRQLAR